MRAGHLARRSMALVRRSAVGLLVLLATPLAAQQGDSTAGADTTSDALPFDVAGEAAFLFNRPAALRATGNVAIASGQVVEGNVAVLDGSLEVAGRIRGRALVINGDLILRDGAAIESGVLVVGGGVRGDTTGRVTGSVRAYPQRLAYRQMGDMIVADSARLASSDASWFERWRRRHRRSTEQFVLKAGTYNRVEGLPVLAGPRLRRTAAWGRISAEALGIYRSADDFTWRAENLGYDVMAEVQVGRERGVAVGLEAFDVVAPVEAWQLRDSEVALASFFLHRDFRDHYDRHGVRGWVPLRRGNALALTVTAGEERWESRRARDPFTLFRNGAHWRSNPAMDEGRFVVTGIGVRVDTRNDVETPWSGWLIAADVEHGRSDAVRLAPTSELVRAPSSEPVEVRYTRGFLDLRRYNRVSPVGQLNMRLVAGGWLGGDPLPLQRRLSVAGVGSLPGYDFRDIAAADVDVLTCGSGTIPDGTPAQCDRILLGQLEYRGDLGLRLPTRGDLAALWSSYHPASWVIFTDFGRGWIVGPRAGTLRYPSGALPPIDTFKADVGVGVDFVVLGLFVAKSITDSENPANFHVRLRHRF